MFHDVITRGIGGAGIFDPVQRSKICTLWRKRSRSELYVDEYCLLWRLRGLLHRVTKWGWHSVIWVSSDRDVDSSLSVNAGNGKGLRLRFRGFSFTARTVWPHLFRTRPSEQSLISLNTIRRGKRLD